MSPSPKQHRRKAFETKPGDRPPLTPVQGTSEQRQTQGQRTYHEQNHDGKEIAVQAEITGERVKRDQSAEHQSCG